MDMRMYGWMDVGKLDDTPHNHATEMDLIFLDRMRERAGDGKGREREGEGRTF